MFLLSAQQNIGAGKSKKGKITDAQVCIHKVILPNIIHINKIYIETEPSPK